MALLSGPGFDLLNLAPYHEAQSLPRLRRNGASAAGFTSRPKNDGRSESVIQAIAVVLGSALILSMVDPAFAGAEMPCEKVEYARLKDMDRKELSSEYCSAANKAQLNQNLQKISDDSFSQSGSRTAMEDSRLRGEARVSCIAVQEDVARMLKKKYGAKQPKC